MLRNLLTRQLRGMRNLLDGLKLGSLGQSRSATDLQGRVYSSNLAHEASERGRQAPCQWLLTKCRHACWSSNVKVGKLS